MELKDLKKEYTTLAKKYRLPPFEELNENFEIYKVDKESDVLLHVIRKLMAEKIVSWLGFIEMLLNPMNAPRMYHVYIKSMGEEDRENIEKIYNTFAEISTESLEREIDYSEKREAELVKKVFDTWNSVKPYFRKIIGNIKKPSNIIGKKEKSYLG